jgi:hypothetical protein
MAVEYNPRIVTDGLILYLDAANRKSYPGTGTGWFDLSNKNNHGILTNGPVYSTQNLGQITLDETDDTITLPIPLNDVNALSNFSIDKWVRFNSYPTALSVANGSGYKRKNGVIIGSTYYSGTALYWTGNEFGTGLEIFGFIRGNDAYRNTAYFSPTLNTWVNMTIVNNFSNSKFSLYVNGNFHSETDGPTQEYNTGLADIAGNLGINKPQVDGGGIYNYAYLNFIVSNVKIYQNKALTQQEIQKNFNALRGRFNL